MEIEQFNLDDHSQQKNESERQSSNQIVSLSNSLKELYDNGDINATSQVKKLQKENIKRKKNIYKQVEFQLEKIQTLELPRNLNILFTYGDLIVDLSQSKNEIKFSAWNFYKKWEKTEIWKNSNVLAIHLENRYKIDDEQNKQQIQQFKSYPDQDVYQLMQNMDYYFEISKLLIIYLTNYFELMKQQPIFLQGFFKRRDLFDIKMDQIYQKFNEQGLIYFSIHTGPDIETNDFQFYKTIYSESLAFLLGKTLSELEEIFRRTGVYDYFDFQTSIEIVRLMVEFKIQFFNSLTQNKQNICQSINENLQFKKQFKVFTYDDLEFYTDVQCKIYKMSDFCDDSKHFLDFYCSILVLDISPSMLKQIITIREQNLKFKELNESKQENIDFTYNIEYMAQAEIFKEKYVDEQKINYTKYLSQYSQNQNKVCNYKLV